MQTHRTTTRRSFLARVAAGGLIGGAGLIFGGTSGAAQQKAQGGTRQMVVDADPRDPARPPSPRSPAPPARPSDSDAGPTSDASGNGMQTQSQPPERFVVCPGNPRCPS